MSNLAPQFITVGDGAAERRIATLIEPRGAPGLLWLPGFKSEMVSLKATDHAAFAAEQGLSMARFDYSGHGRSGGDFDRCTVGGWLEEARAVFTGHTKGPIIIIASSMGGHIALLLLRALMRDAPAESGRVKALVLIAPAWDMTRLMWKKLPESARREIEQNGVYLRPSHYGDGPYRITKSLLDEGEAHRIGDSAFNPGRPVRILHGLQDPDVPWEHTLDLVAHLDGDWTEVTAVPDGEHRLSRPEDLTLLRRIVAEEIRR